MKRLISILGLLLVAFSFMLSTAYASTVNLTGVTWTKITYFNGTGQPLPGDTYWKNDGTSTLPYSVTSTTNKGVTYVFPSPIDLTSYDFSNTTTSRLNVQIRFYNASGTQIGTNIEKVGMGSSANGVSILGVKQIAILISQDATGGYTANFNTPVLNGYVAPALSVPTGLTVSSGDKSVILSWSANTEPNLKGYNLYKNSVLLASNLTNRSFSDSGLTNGSNYQYQITSVNTDNVESVKSTAVTGSPVSSVDINPPTVPTGFNAIKGNAEVYLSWNRNVDSDLSGYDIYRDGFRIVSLAKTDTYYTDPNRLNGTTYNYQILAFDTSYNESAKTAGITVTPSATSTPAPVTKVTVVNGGGSANIFDSQQGGKISQTVSWPASNGASSYDVYMDGVKITSIIAPQKDVTIINLLASHTYTYKVNSTNANGSTPPPVGYVPPSMPTGSIAFTMPVLNISVQDIFKTIESVFGPFWPYMALILGVVIAWAIIDQMAFVSRLNSAGRSIMNSNNRLNRTASRGRTEWRKQSYKNGFRSKYVNRTGSKSFLHRK